MSGSDPWIVEVTRGGLVESRHAVSVVVLDPAGAVVTAAGDVDAAIYPRSALKPAQAVAVLEALHDARTHADLTDADLTDAEVALAAGSHSGEAVHREAVTALLHRHGLGTAALRCPPDLPLGAEAARALLAAGGAASPLTMNCSGKHAAMLVASGGSPDHLDPAHPLQQRVRATVERLAGPVLGASVDGCGAPAFAIRLVALARLGSALTTAAPGTPEYRVAAAMRARPDLVAGTGRLDTVVMTALPGALSKTGAEGVLLAVLPDGASVALKVHDGAGRAVGAALGEVLRRHGLAAGDQLAPPVLGGGRPVGELRVSAPAP